MKSKILLIALVFLLLSNTKIFAENFIIEASEIQISGDGNIIQATDGIALSKVDNLEIKAKKFEYNKKNLTLNATNGLAIVSNKNIQIKANKFIYNEDISKLTAIGNVEVRDIVNKLLIKSEKIFFDSKSKNMESKTSSSIEDQNGNLFSTDMFFYSSKDGVVKFDNAKLIDIEKNITTIKKAYLNLNTNQILGKDFSADFNNNSFNVDNNPRLKGNSFSSEGDTTTISKGVFTSCKKNDTCPPWQISAKKIRHDKKKKILYYDNAWLKLYDTPVFYFPKFFHPDPSVKRQSGFLMPTVVSSSNLGSAFNVPYYFAVADNKDFTIKPRLYSNQKMLLQTEYREVNKKSKHTMDFSSLINDNKSNKSHFFSKYISEIDFFNFEETDLKFDLQLSSDDDYLKAYKVTSPIIDNSNLLNTTLEIDAYSEDLTFNTNLSVIKDLSKNNNARYEFIYPSYSLSKELKQIDSLEGRFFLNSSGQARNYDSNIYEKTIINDLKFNSDSKFYQNGIINDYKFLIKNINTNTKNSLKYKEKTNHDVASIFEYNLSYPLKKNNKNSYNILSPLASIKFSPSKNRNMRNESKRIDANNIFDLNRLGSNDAVEGGTSLTYGFDYIKNDKKDQEIFKGSIASIARLEENKNLPTESTLGKKNSDIVGTLNYIPNHILKLNYDFSLDNNLDDTNYQLLGTEIKINNFVTTFEYLNDNNSPNKDSYYTSKNSLSIDESSSVSFNTRQNKKTDLTEFYNLIYQYRNDCLIAAIEYNKDFYSDGALRPEENIFFKLTIVPFGKTSSPNLLD
tara:strand:- start:84 stop:2465 length:2382 start_codon:yes stop_codon:yes gene_type:complete